MSERTEQDMTPFQVNKAIDTIRIVVPINYGNGVLLFDMRYSIGRKHPDFPSNKYANLVGLVGVHEGHWINDKFKPKFSSDSAGLVPNLTVIRNITEVLNYLKFVRELVEKGDHRTYPPSFFGGWRKQFENWLTRSMRMEDEYYSRT